MMKWMVFNARMDVIGIVVANDYNEAWSKANDRWSYVEYIQEI